MKHLGDITKLNGANIPPVWCVIGGSPCQDLSVAGKGAGLKHAAHGDGETTRSGLFIDQIRICKEMRENDRRAGRTDEFIRPRIMCWENVPGAFSSGTPKGADFAVVLEEAIRVAEPEAPPVPVPEAGWPSSGVIYDEMGKWSVAWRVHDAQFFGLAQRRKRISLVCDWGGLDAPWIVLDPQLQREAADTESQETLFGSGTGDGSAIPAVKESLSGNPDPCGEPWQETAGAAQDRAEDPGRGVDAYNGTLTGEVAAVGGTNTSGAKVLESTAWDGEQTSPTLTARNAGGAQRMPDKDNFNCVIAYAIDQQGGKGSAGYAEDVMPSLLSDSHGTPHATAYNIGSYHSNAWLSENPDSGVYETDKSKTLDALNCGTPNCNQGGTAVVEPVCYNGENITNPINAANPQPGDPCHTLDRDSRNYLVEPNILDMTHANDVIRDCGATAPTLQNRMGTGGNQIPLCLDVGFFEAQEDIAPAQLARQYKDPPAVVDEQVGTLCDNGYPDKLTNQDVVSGLYPAVNSVVRRLTCRECERLQGFPDDWTLIGTPEEVTVKDYEYVFHPERYDAPEPILFGVDEADIDAFCRDETLDDATEAAVLEYLKAEGEAREKATEKVVVGSHKETQHFFIDTTGKKRRVTDSMRYKALGNSIAVGYANNRSGFWMWLVGRISEVLSESGETPTLGSLFDGIGGFPLAWEYFNGKGSAVWASEIEEFPIAVTKQRFPEEDT